MRGSSSTIRGSSTISRDLVLFISAGFVRAASDCGGASGVLSAMAALLLGELVLFKMS